MSHVLPSASIRWDVEVGSLLLANMLSAWLDNQVVGKATEAAAYEPPQDHRASPQPVGLCVPPPVNSRPSASPSREHGASVCVAGESAGTRLEPSFDPHARPRSGKVGSADSGTGRLQDLSGGCLDGTSGRSVCFGSLPPLALGLGLASAAGAVCAHENSGYR